MDTCPVVRTIWITKQGKFLASIGNARVSALDIRDIAAVATAALTESGHERLYAHWLADPDPNRNG